MYYQKSNLCGVADAPSVFPIVRELYLHGMQQHFQTGGKALQARLWEISQAPWETEEDDSRLNQVYEANEPLILDNHQESSVISSYNVPLNDDFTNPQMMDHAQRIYDRQDNAFRLNLEYGLI